MPNDDGRNGRTKHPWIRNGEKTREVKPATTMGEETSRRRKAERGGKAALEEYMEKGIFGE